MGSSHSSETAGDASYSPSGSPRASHEEVRTVLEEERVDRKKWNQSELKTAWRKNDIMTGHEDNPYIRRDQFGHAVQHRLAAAANSQSSGGTILHEYPDFILPFVIQSLAHHPDFLAAEDAAEDASVLEPFQKMLQFALEPLLSMSTATVQAVASAVFKSQQSSKAKGKQPSSASTAVPGNVPLPASFYRSLDMRTSERKTDGSHLPEGFEAKLADLMPKQPSPADKPQKDSKAKGQGKSPMQEPGSAKGKRQKAGRKRKSDESRSFDGRKTKQV